MRTVFKRVAKWICGKENQVIRNHTHGYGWPSRVLHWVMTLLIVFLFGLGLWMVELNYFHAWYQKAPLIHNGVGLIVALLLITRYLWRYLNVRPVILGSRFSKGVAHLTHSALYLLMFIAVISGYLINTADGSEFSFFGWFDIPALYKEKGLEQWSGVIHQYAAYGLVILAGIHAIAALKHHWIDGDQTLRRMLRG